jgi:glycosyltransferase involved in cell wall biosynthesis
MNPRVSVLIPSYNDEKYIEQSIESVIRQTYKDWELIVLDDCSTDRTYAKALLYSINPNVKVYQNEVNLGMLENWNKGIDLCRSEYFIKLDADDYWHPEMLEKAVSILNNNLDVGLVFTKYIEVDEESLPIDVSNKILPEFAINKSFDCHSLVKEGSEFMLSYDILRQGLSIMRRNIFDQIGKYHYLLTKETHASTDTEFYFRVGCHYNIFQLNEALYYYRKHPKSISAVDKGDNLQAQKLYEIKISILQYYLKNGVISQSFFKKKKKKVRFNYYSFLFSKFRQTGRIFSSLKYLARNLRMQPRKTIMENLHFNQIF